MSNPNLLLSEILNISTSAFQVVSKTENLVDPVQKIRDLLDELSNILSGNEELTERFFDEIGRVKPNSVEYVVIVKFEVVSTAE